MKPRLKFMKHHIILIFKVRIHLFLDEGVFFLAILWCIYFTTYYFLSTSQRLLIGSTVAQW